MQSTGIRTVNAQFITYIQKITPRLTRYDQTNKMLTSLPSMQTD